MTRLKYGNQHSQHPKKHKKQPETRSKLASQWIAEDLQNNRVLTYEGCFGFHRVANAKESRLSERA